MPLLTLDPRDLPDLTQTQLAEYRERLRRWRALQGPWATHMELARYALARTEVEREERRRGAQMRLC